MCASLSGADAENPNHNTSDNSRPEQLSLLQKLSAVLLAAMHKCMTLLVVCLHNFYIFFFSKKKKKKKKKRVCGGKT